MPDLEAYKTISGGNTQTIVSKRGSGLLHRARLLNHDVPKICRKEGADALLCLGNFVPWKQVCPTGVLLHNPWVVYHDSVAESRRTVRENLITTYARQAYRHLSRDVTIITQTQVMKEHLCASYGVDPARVAIIPNTFSVAKPAENSDSAPAGGDGKVRPFTFLYLTHYYAHKNIEILLDALLALPKYTDKPAKCLITIAPEQHPGARRLLERLGQGEGEGKIENIGPVPSTRLFELYRRTDALIFPTLLESFSRTYLEAMYFGIPILTSDRDFARHLCQDAAIYQDPLDAESVARGMARLMQDAALRQSLVANGKHVLEQVPVWDEIASRFVEVLEQMARGQLVNVKEKMVMDAPMANHVRVLFNNEARHWQSKYGPGGKLDSRVEQFAARLAAVCRPPCNVLDLGCGTGDIAAALGERGYPVTACDFAEEMIDVARRSHQGSAVQWVKLEPDWEVLPFADGAFDSIIASSVFEYVVDVPRVAAELARVLRPAGSLLLTVPNPGNALRKLEAWAQSTLLRHPLPQLLRRVQKLDSYTTYLRLSRNRFGGSQWDSLLRAAGFAAIDPNDFAEAAWRKKSKSPLIMLTVQRTTAAAPLTEADVRQQMAG